MPCTTELNSVLDNPEDIDSFGTVTLIASSLVFFFFFFYKHSTEHVLRLHLGELIYVLSLLIAAG